VMKKCNASSFLRVISVTPLRHTEDKRVDSESRHTQSTDHNCSRLGIIGGFPGGSGGRRRYPVYIAKSS
jgi:hypothetical protein